MLSPHLPLGASVQDSERLMTVQWFFENLLPEGALREVMARKIGVGPQNIWGLIRQYGKEVAGAITILPEGVSPEATLSMEPVAFGDISGMIRESRETGVPMMAQGASPHISLAGAQEKIAVHIDDSGGFWLPRGTTPSTWILKPESASNRYPFCPANEWLCMNLAKAVWTNTPEVRLFAMEEFRVYGIRRYDRVVEHGKIVRLHQIDLCQANNVPSSKKYDDGTGVSMDDLFATLKNCALPVNARQFAIQWIVLNYLIGNDDAHAKNLSFLIKGGKMSVAPVYDLLCVDAYHKNHRLSMPIDDQIQAGWVERKHWEALALKYGVKPAVVLRTLQEVSRLVDFHLPALLKHPCLSPEELAWLGDCVVPVIRQRIQFANEALKPVVSNKLKPTSSMGMSQT